MLRSEIFQEAKRICNDYKELFESDEILFKEVAGLQKEMRYI